MKRALLLLAVSACASSERPARTVVAIAPPSASASPEPEPTVSAEDAGVSDEKVFDAMNANAPPNNHSPEEEALLDQMLNNGHPPTHGPPVVHVDNDTTELHGQLLIVRRIVRQNAAAIRACYDKGRATQPDLAGRVVLRFRIDASGNVTSAESTSRTTLPSPSVVGCVASAIKSIVFPQMRGGLVVDNYPIVFAP
jgi:hypothetical protein